MTSPWHPSQASIDRPVGALHVTGVLIGCIAGLGAVAATAPPAVRNTSVPG